MNDDELRRVLDSYAGAAPATDPRPGLASGLARRTRRRRAAVASLAAVAAVAAGTGVSALTRDRSGPAAVAQSPTAAASATRAAPPVVARAEGPHGLRVTATLDPGDPATGTYAGITVEATDDDGKPEIVTYSWGDGVEVERSFPTPLCAIDPTPPPRTKEPGSLRETVRHAWRHPGPWTVSLTVHSWIYCLPTDPPAERATVVLVVDVRPGLVTSNGPAPPEVVGADPTFVWRGGKVRERGVAATLRDRDGHVSVATVDWGDGTRSSFPHAKACEDGGGTHFPGASRPSYFRVEERHVYASPGTYTMTLRITSTGCDGEDEQTTTLTEQTTA